MRQLEAAALTNRQSKLHLVGRFWLIAPRTSGLIITSLDRLDTLTAGSTQLDALSLSLSQVSWFSSCPRLAFCTLAQEAAGRAATTAVVNVYFYIETTGALVTWLFSIDSSARKQRQHQMPEVHACDGRARCCPQLAYAAAKF